VIVVTVIGSELELGSGWIVYGSGSPRAAMHS
jgi:hypothetical protein